MKKRYSTLCSALLALVLVLMAADNAWAAFAANTRITSQATLTYSDGAATRTASAAVTVTIALVPSPPNIIGAANQSATYSGATSTINGTFTIISTANGPETFKLSGAVTAFSNTSGAAAGTTLANVTIGASILLPGSTAGSILVPSDGDLPTGPAGVNEIEIGDTVVINGEARTVGNLVNNNDGTWTIVLSANLSAIPAAGMLVAEQKTVPLAVTAGTIETQGTDITVSANIAAVSTATGSSYSASAPTLFTFTSGLANIFKYVRNATQAMVGATSYAYNSQTYYATGVTGQPGDLLEYLLVAQNTGGAAISQAVVTDLLPTEYVTIKDSAYALDREITYVSETGAISTHSKAADTDLAVYDAATGILTVNVGTGASSSAGGSIAGGNSSVLILYQINIKP